MNRPRRLKTATALALLASAFAVQAATVPSGCQRVSGEEGADEQYFGSDSQGNAIFCAAGTAKNATPLPRGGSAGAAVKASPYSDPAQGYNDAASQSGSAYGQGGGSPQGDYGQGAASYPPAQTGGWQGSGSQPGAGAGGYGSASGGYGGAGGGYGGGSAGGIQGGSFKGGAHSQNNGAGAAGSNPYASGTAFVKRPKKCKSNCPPADAPVDQSGYGAQPYGGDTPASAGGPSSSQGDEGGAAAGSWVGASGNDHNHVPVDTPPFGDAPGGALNDPGSVAASPLANEPNALKKPPVDPQQFQTETLPKPLPKLPGGLLEPAPPKPPVLVQELPQQIPLGNKPATLIEIKPGAAIGGSAAVEAGKEKAKKKPPAVTQWPKP